MKNVLIALLIGIIVGVVGTWYFQQERESATAVKEAEKRAGEAATKAREALGQAAAGVKDAFAAKLEALELRAQDVRDDLARSGRVVRRAAREAGEGVADAARDAAITAEIKGSSPPTRCSPRGRSTWIRSAGASRSAAPRPRTKRSAARRCSRSRPGACARSSPRCRSRVKESAARHPGERRGDAHQALARHQPRGRRHGEARRERRPAPSAPMPLEAGLTAETPGG